MKYNNKHQAEIDFSSLYNEHSDYILRRNDGSFEHAQVLIEAKKFKIPWLISLLPKEEAVRSVLEIGCGTGELIGNFPVSPNDRRVGCDISLKNIEIARKRYPDVCFFSCDFSDILGDNFDLVVLSDILEHVPSDCEFLAKAAKKGRYILINLPLENNWLNYGRNYGVEDTSGHLRKYSLEEGLNLFRHAGLTVLGYHQVWSHETSLENYRRDLRKQHFGEAYSGGPILRMIKHGVISISKLVTPLGRNLFASNLFALTEKKD